MNRSAATPFLIVGCVLALLMGMAISGCSLMGIKAPPSVCDSVGPGESMLCDLAKKYDLHLETVGNFLMVANMRAIQSGAYSKPQARLVFSILKNDINMLGISGSDIMGMVDKYVGEFPELFLVAPYLGYLDTPDLVREKDRELLNSWLDQQIEHLQ